MSKSVIISSSSPVLTGRLYALYGSATNVIFAALSLILNCPSLELAVTVHRGLPTRRPLPCIPCNPYISIQSSTGSYIVEFNMSTYPGPYPSFLVFILNPGLRA
jgi:hypothetical protein